MTKITLSDVNKKRLRILIYLITSGVLAWILSTYIVGNPSLVLVFQPAINFIEYSIVEELKQEGYIQVLRNKINV